MKKLLAALSICLAMNALAQNEVDALRLSFWEFEGSARYLGMGGAMGALGGDFSVAATNPAGLGKFRSSSISVSPGFTIGKTSTSFRGLGTEDDYTRASVTEGHFLKSVELLPERANGWNYLQVGIGYNRLVDFNRTFTYSGPNTTSLLDVYQNQANSIGTTPEFIYDDLPFTAGLAYDVYLLDWDTLGQFFYSPLTVNSEIEQTREVERKKSIGEWDFTLSGNYKDKIYAGVALGITFGGVVQSIYHNEVITDSLSDLQEFNYTEDLETQLSGVNLKLGLIYEPVSWLKFGASIHTPTRMVLRDDWSATMDSRFPEGPYTVADEFIPYGSYNYILITPTRFMASLGTELDKRLIAGLEASYTDYSWTKFKPHSRLGDGYGFERENAAIDTLYNSSVMVRTGLEVRVYKGLLLRAGYAYYSSPYQNKDLDASRMWYSGGLGWKGEHVFFDVAYRYTKRGESYYQYNVGDPGNLAEVNDKRHLVTFTLGGRF